MLSMKNVFALVGILLLLGSSTFSQDSFPKIRIIEGDTLFCFTVNQARDISERSELFDQCVEHRALCDDEVLAKDYVILKKGEAISKLIRNQGDYNSLDEQRNIQIKAIINQNQMLKKKISTMRKHKIGLGIAAIAGLLLLLL